MIGCSKQEIPWAFRSMFDVPSVRSICSTKSSRQGFVIRVQERAFQEFLVNLIGRDQQWSLQLLSDRDRKSVV